MSTADIFLLGAEARAGPSQALQLQGGEAQILITFREVVLVRKHKGILNAGLKKKKKKKKVEVRWRQIKAEEEGWINGAKLRSIVPFSPLLCPPILPVSPRRLLPV